MEMNVRNKIITAIPAILVCASSYAGVMGPVEAPIPGISPFVSAEGAYTWNKLEPYVVNSSASSLDKNGWGGRLAGGFIQPILNNYEFSFEGGLGYYGNTVKNTNGLAPNPKTLLEGLDVLIGGAYKYNQFGLFLKGGAMILNRQTKVTNILGEIAPGGLLSGSRTINNSVTEMMPEIKVGGLYDVNPNLAITVSYMHVFGANNGGYSNIITSPDSINYIASMNQKNPTLNSVLFGLQYKFV